MRYSVLLAIFNVLYSLSSGILQQHVNSQTICLDDTVIFICTIEDSNFVVWDISRGLIIMKSFALTHPIPVGRKYYETTGTSLIIAEITFINSTSITSSLTIMGASGLIGYSISCNSDMITLTPVITASTFLPTDLIMMPIGVHNYIIYATISVTVPSAGIEINLIVSPPPVYGSDTEIFNNSSSSTILGLSINTVYTINISLCPDRVNTFVIGRCPLVLTSKIQSALYYNISMMGTVTALIRCVATNEPEYFMLDCGMNGEWNMDSNVNCINLPTTNKEEGSLEGISPGTNDSSTEVITMNNLDITINISVLSSSAIGICILCFSTGIVFGITSERMKNRIKHLKNARPTLHANMSEQNRIPKTARFPEYEEVELADKESAVELTPNMAYMSVHRIISK